MSSIKISQLPNLPSIAANTSNTIFLGVDLPTDTTGKFTATTLAQQLYANNALIVGANPLLFSNTVGQLSGYDPTFLQVNMQNFNGNGSADFVITGDKGTNSNNFIDMGLNGSTFQTNPTVGSAYLPNDGYLYVQGPGQTGVGNLLIATASTNTRIMFAPGGLNANNIVGYIDNQGLHFQSIDAEIAANLASAKTYTDTRITLSDANAATLGATVSQAYTVANNALANSVNLTGTVSILQSEINSNANSLIALTTYAQAAYNTVNSLVISSNTAALALQVQTIYNEANAVFAQANNSVGVEASQNNNIQLAWNQANTSVQNTSTITVNNSIVIPGNATFGSNSIIYGDWSNSNVAQRTAFMTSTPNGNTGVYVIPNGSSVSASIQVINSSNTTNASKLLISANGTSNVQIASTRNGTGTYLPMDFNTNGMPQMSLDLSGTLNILNGGLNILTGVITTPNTTINNGITTTSITGNTLSLTSDIAAVNAVFSGNVTANYVVANNVVNATEVSIQAGSTYWNFYANNNMYATGNIWINNSYHTGNVVIQNSGVFQYTTSNNAVVTQQTNKSTAVTANGRTGQITTNNANINKGAAVQFTVNNNQIVSAKDVVIVNIASGATVNYAISVISVTPGSFVIMINNSDGTPSGSNAADTLVINFAIIRVN
jgi:hypothetical protein